MNETNRPDQVTDALITRGLIRPDGAGSCPDPSLLAGIHEGNLEPDETERWLTHLADCERCQATLGALARADETARRSPAEAASWWRVQSARALRWPVRAPLAAAALIVMAVWVIDPGSTPDGSSSAARGTDTIAEQVVTEPAVAATSQPLPETSGPPTRESVSPPTEETEDRLAQASAAAETADAGPTAIQAVNLRRAETPEDVLGAASRARSNSPPVAENTPRRGARARPTADQQGALFIVPVLLRSPQDAIQWRAGPSGDIERTDDGGRSWRVQLTVSERVVAGDAPSAAVAWMVGEQGLVLRTLDGEQWSRLSLPTDATLVAVEAADGRRATVTTADGLQFRTVDAGSEWTPLP